MSNPPYRRCSVPFLPAVALLLGAAGLVAQRQPHWIVPARAVFAPPGTTPVVIEQVDAEVLLQAATARTTLTVGLHNPGTRAEEAVLLLPVPDGAAVSGFTFSGPAAEPTTQVLAHDEARRLYDQIVARQRDPALLEFVGWRCVRSSVFPVPAHGRLQLRLTYEHVLPADGRSVDYLLPRSESLAAAVPWSITVLVPPAAKLGSLFSPSHALATHVLADGTRSLSFTEASRREPGPFRLAAAREHGQHASALLYAWPDPTVGGGWFLLVAEPMRLRTGRPMPREVLLVVDRSGSMAGEKLAQTKHALRHVVDGLRDGERFQLLDYGNDVGRAFAAPVAKDATTLAAARRWIDDLRPLGGTNLHDALVEALRTPTAPGHLPLVLLLSDGVPTVGPTRPTDLQAMVAAANVHQRRVFCFGVGNDVDAPLLDHLATATRGVTEYVLPGEDVQAKVARTFARLGVPVLAAPTLRTVDARRQPVARVHDVLPHALPDLFAGDQLTVLGRYTGDDDLTFELAGDTPLGRRDFTFTLPVRSASTSHGFVPRLWASRQIAFLVDQLRQQGLDRPGAGREHDPRWRELSGEILRLSTRFGVLGEYTAFLATEGSDLGDWSALVGACQANLQGRALGARTGAGAVNQGCNLWAQKQQVVANYHNRYLDAGLRQVESAAVQQIADCAFWQRGGRWIDGRAVAHGRTGADEQIAFGSARWHELRASLQAEGRAAVLSLAGELLVRVGDRNVLVTGPAAVTPSSPTSPSTPLQEIR
jgi:Ca-activated chloride channel family protein